jgi:hypothetical protein
MRLGCLLSSQEWGPNDLVRQAQMARRAGFDRLWISDHYLPWNNAQGHSPFVWSTVAAIAATVPGVTITTAVTGPTLRIQPAVIAQAAATSAVLLEGRPVLPTPQHFERASSLVTEEMATEQVPCGRDPDRHVEALRAYEQAAGS